VDELRVVVLELLVVVLELLDEEELELLDEEELELLGKEELELLGKEELEVEVELEGEVVVVELEELEEAGADVERDVVVVVVVVELDVESVVQTGVRAAAEDSGSPVAVMICATVARAGTGTVRSLPGIVTEQVSLAEAVGSAARAIITRTALAIASTKPSLRRLITAALLL
jgi:hypothetical protein